MRTEHKASPNVLLGIIAASVFVLMKQGEPDLMRTEHKASPNVLLGIVAA